MSLARLLKTLGSLLVACAFTSAGAQEFKPHPQAEISVEQWQAYFNEVSSKHGGDMKDLDAEKLVVFFDRSTATAYAFTKPGHPAYPAWVTRRVQEKDGKIGVSQIGYFAGNKEEFGKLFRAYQRLNDRMREDLAPARRASAPASASIRQ
jgi:hypothetical protein